MTVEDFITHFRNVSSTPHPSNFNPQEYEPREESVNIDELDCPFTNAEIIKTLTSLKRHKSPDMNDNVADFFIDSKDLLHLISVICLIMYIIVAYIQKNGARDT